MRGPLIAVLVVFASVAGTCGGGALAVAALAERGDVVARCAAPADVRYDDGRYEVAVALGATVPHVLLAGPRLWELRVQREGVPDNGHVTWVHALGATPSSARCSFDVDGIRVAFDTGHTVFVPKKSFVGGR
jgi:hypothetical protein